MTLIDLPTPLVVLDANGNLVTPANMIFLGGGIEADQSKSAQAIFVEAATDITDSLELRGALRYESLEDDSTVDPKLSLEDIKLLMTLSLEHL